MKLRHPWLIRAASFLVAGLIRAWTSTLRYRLSPEDGRTHPLDPDERRVIYVIWHEYAILPAVFRSRVAVLVSQHADGELIARACHHLGLGTVRGSTTRGGASALMELTRAARSAHLMLTPDGPRGPRRQLQRGAIFLASQTGLPIIPVGVGCTSGWRAKSWDRTLIPRPFGTIRMVVGREIAVPPDLDRDGLEEQRARVEAELHRVNEAAEALAQPSSPRKHGGPHLRAKSGGGVPLEPKE